MRTIRTKLVLATLIVAQVVFAGSVGAQVGALRRRAADEAKKRAEAAAQKLAEDSVKKTATGDASAKGAPASTGAQPEGRFSAKLESADVPPKFELAEFQRSKVFISGVVEMTMDGMTRFHRGLDTEIRLLEEFAAQLDTYRMPAEYATCIGTAGGSPDAQKIIGRMTDLPENASAEQREKAMAKMNEEMQALLTQKCGADVRVEWPQSKRDEKLKAIVTQAAAATGPASDATRGRGGPAPEDEVFDLVDQQGALTDAEYKVWQERVGAYCAYKKLRVRQGKMWWTPGEQLNIAFEARTLNPKVKAGIPWVFTWQEVVHADRECDDLILKIGKIQQIIEAAPINIRGRRR